MNKTISRRLGLAAVVVVTLLLAVANPSGVRLLHPSTASAAPDQLSGTPFGVSGGNAKDISALFCCSGTLGSLVTDGSGRFILSNNHVLARTDSASLNEDISQPGATLALSGGSAMLRNSPQAEWRCKKSDARQGSPAVW